MDFPQGACPHGLASPMLPTSKPAMPMPTTPFLAHYPVRAYEIGPAGHTSLQTVCNYMQDAAGDHAERLGVSVEQLLPQGLTWVMRRLHIQLHHLPHLHDVVEVETWPSGRNRLMATRDFYLRSGDAELGRATSAWLVLDIERRRPIRLPQQIIDIPLAERPRALEDPFDRLPEPDAVAHTCLFSVRYSDLDLNGHVNNVRYIEWAVESIPQHALDGRRIVDHEVEFRAETVHGDAVVVETSAEQDGVYVHRLSHQGDGRVVAMSRTRVR